MHENESPSSIQVPPFLQGDESQGYVLYSKRKTNVFYATSIILMITIFNIYKTLKELYCGRRNSN